MKTFTPSPHQQRFFDWVRDGSGNAILVAVAGAGKSTSITRALRYVDENAHVKLLAFNAPIAKELNERVDALRTEWGRALRNVSAATFHSLGYGPLRKYLQTSREPDGKKVQKLAQTLLGDADRDAYGDYVVSLVGYAKGEGVGRLVPDEPETWAALAAHHDLYLTAASATEARAIQLARELLELSTRVARTEGSIDFDDMLYLPVLWQLRLWQHDWLFVDEAQDTNPVRRALARMALRPRGRLVAVGDPGQSIYGFTGASHDALDLVKRDFAASELPLTVSYRCARAVVADAQRFSPLIEAHEGAPAGEVLHLSLDEALKLLGPHDAILCRQTAPLLKTAYALIARGVGCRVLGREIGDGLVKLVKQLKAKDLATLEERLTTWRDREVAKLEAKQQELRAEAIRDRAECIFTVVAALPETERTVPKLLAKLAGIFTDTNGVLVLSSVHKAKGREWETVAILRPDLMPSKRARQPWQQVQEVNLQYVAATRAKTRLIYLTDPAPAR